MGEDGGKTQSHLCIEDSSHDSKNGPSTIPALVALPPFTPCTKRGTYEEIPNISTPSTIPPILEIPMMRLLKSVKGKIGSAARRSSRRNRPMSTINKANKPILGSESHAQLVPPWSRAKSNATIAPVRVNVPM